MDAEEPVELLEVDINKPSAGAALGIVCEPNPSGGAGAVVSELLPSAIGAKSGVIYVGDVIASVNGVAIADAAHALSLLRTEALTVTVEIVCTTGAQQRLSPPHVMDTILSLRLNAQQKEYLVRWSPSERRTWATLTELMESENTDMW